MPTSEPTIRPVFPLGSAVLPGVVVPLRIFEDRYRALAEQLASDQSDRRFATVMIERGSEVGGSDTRTDVGCILEVVAMQHHPDDTWSLAAAATGRMRVVEWLADDPYPRAIVEAWPDQPRPPVTPSDVSLLLDSVHRLADLADGVGLEIQTPDIDAVSTAGALWRVAAAIPIGDLDRYRVLAAPSAIQRFHLLMDLTRQQLEMLHLMSQQGDNPNG